MLSLQSLVACRFSSSSTPLAPRSSLISSASHIYYLIVFLACRFAPALVASLRVYSLGLVFQDSPSILATLIIAVDSLQALGLPTSSMSQMFHLRISTILDSVAVQISRVSDLRSS